MGHEFVAKRATELYLARVLSKMAGQLKGKEVVAAHKCIVEVKCAGKTGWDALECVVDNMEILYKRIKEVGFEKAMKEVSCW
ncbi:MAG: hypothetical protein QXQ91_04460 [Nanopusillaceae archaeon]